MPSEWIFETGVQTFGPSGQSEWAFFTVPQAELNASHSATIPPSTSAASYLVSIGESFASYLIDTQHSCINTINGRPRCISDGYFLFTPRTDVNIELSSEYSYTLGADWMTGGSALSVYRWPYQGPADTLFFQSEQVSTTFMGPHSGVLSLPGGTVMLQGGSLYRVAYGQEVIIIDAPLNSAATATGNILITITAIPEPTSAVGLLACLLLVGRRCPR
jgi:hypothetical protein